MFKKKVFISMIIFSILMFLTALIKTQTRIIEKNIHSHQIKISELNNNIYEAQLEYFYLSSPENLSNRRVHQPDLWRKPCRSLYFGFMAESRVDAKNCTGEQLGRNRLCRQKRRALRDTMVYPRSGSGPMRTCYFGNRFCTVPLLRT